MSKFDKLFAKKKKTAAPPKVAVPAAAAKKEPEPATPAAPASREEEVAPAPAPEPVKKKNWFEETDSDEDEAPVAKTDLVQDSRVVQSQKKIQEASKHGEEFWEEQDTEGQKKLKEKQRQEKEDREKRKLESQEMLQKASLDSADVFKMYQKGGFFSSAKRAMGAKGLKNDDFMTLEEAAELPKGGAKKGADGKTQQEEQQSALEAKPEMRKFANKFRDLEKEIGDEDAEAKERASEFSKIVKTKPTGDSWKRGETQDKGFQRGGGKVEEKKGFTRGGGVVESPPERGFNRGEFGTGEVKPFKREGEAAPAKKRESEGGDEDVVFNRRAFGTGKAEERAQAPPPVKRESAGAGWEKGTGMSPPAKAKPSAESGVAAKTEAAVVRPMVKREEAKTLSNDKNTDWDFDL